MAYYGSYLDLPPDGTAYSNNCIDGKCSNCGECCADLLPLTDAEARKVKRYAKAHNLKEHRQAPFFDPKAVDLTCPFRNEQTKRCDVYPVRPLICRAFVCTKSLQQAQHDRDLVHETRSVHSMRMDVFGNPETINFLQSVVTKQVIREMKGGTG